MSDGNLNRNVLHEGPHIGFSKAVVLRDYLTVRHPSLRVESEVCRLEDLVAASGKDFKLHRLISAVDSRRVRRRLQFCCPREIYDASTRGLADIVLHQHQYPTQGACLACIHHETPDEHAHERHIADALGVSIEQIRAGRVSAQAAITIASRIDGLDASALVGQAYDSLFKELCATERLPAGTHGLEGTLAPFCFVSVLAGALLAVEFLSGIASDLSKASSNLWSVNPWNAPRSEMRRWREREERCGFCGDPVMLNAMRFIWGNTIGE